MNKPNLKIDWCSREAAQFACKNWHYSRSLPSCKLVTIGVWEDSRFIGTVIFSRGASPYLLTQYNLKMTEGCELTRVALDKHIHPVSRIIKIALKKLQELSPGLRLVVSFADPEQDHVGGIYQAGNWIYAGTSSPTIEYFINGRWQHVRNSYYKKTDKTPIRERRGKLSYLMPLDKDMRRQVEKLRKPYPKRVASIENDASGNQSEEGGANPTATLQNHGTT